MLICFNAEAQPECRDIGGIRHCNADYWIGTSTLVGEERVSSLPSGEVTITERNHCPTSYKGGYLWVVQQQGSFFSTATLIDGEIWREYPPNAPPGMERQTTGQTFFYADPTMPIFGQTVTYKNIFSPAMNWYALHCTYFNCNELEPVSACGREIAYLIGINIANTPGVDLALGPISISGANINVNDGLSIVPVGVPTQINVPVSINYVGVLPSNILSSSVPLTLQVGSYSSTQNISIASLVANQKTMLVPFWVTLQSNDIGLKTLIANVNAGRAVSEPNFSNNEVQLNVHVESAYRIAKEIKIGGLVQESSPIKIAPSKLAGCGSNDIKKVQIKITCLKKQASGEEVPIAGCDITNKLGWFPTGGPHNHIEDVDGNSTEDDLDHLGKIKANVKGVDISVSEELLSIPASGLSLTYEVSEFSGKYLIKYSSKDPEGNSLSLSSSIIEATIAHNLTPLNSLLGFNVASHPNDGYSGTPVLRGRLSIALAIYRAKIIEFNNSMLANPTIKEAFVQAIREPPARSGGASLSWGGAFDIFKNRKTAGDRLDTEGNPILKPNGEPEKNGHCKHREGKNIDISMSPINNNVKFQFLRAHYKAILAQALTDAKFEFLAPGEKRFLQLLVYCKLFLHQRHFNSD